MNALVPFSGPPGPLAVPQSKCVSRNEIAESWALHILTPDVARLPLGWLCRQQGLRAQLAPDLCYQGHVSNV